MSRIDVSRTLSQMSKDERSLLLYLECRTVDHAGLIDAQHMNADDFATAERWRDSGFITFKRIPLFAITGRGLTHRVTLSEEAWTLAHAERRDRFERMTKVREVVKKARGR